MLGPIPGGWADMLAWSFTTNRSPTAKSSVVFSHLKLQMWGQDKKCLASRPRIRIYARLKMKLLS